MDLAPNYWEERRADAELAARLLNSSFSSENPSKFSPDPEVLMYVAKKARSMDLFRAAPALTPETEAAISEYFRSNPPDIIDPADALTHRYGISSGTAWERVEDE